MKNAPSYFKLKDLLKCISEIQTQYSDGSWGPARPIGLDTIPNRIKLAWKVFTGKYDVLEWPDNQ